LGSGCKKCENLESNAKEAISELGLEAEVIKVTDFGEIASFGVAKTPALVVDEKVIVSGRVAETSEIKDLIGNGK
jgi:small redox-active disulfide protein 2